MKRFLSELTCVSLTCPYDVIMMQIDFKTKMLCSIEKGIVNRQFPFARVKSCDDGVGSKFFISFKEYHDYELEATSLEDKHKVR